MSILKPVRKFLIQLVMTKMGLSTENFSVVDIIDDDSRPNEILPVVEDWLDENYPGINRRWSDKGYKMWEEADHFRTLLEEEYERLDEEDE